MALDARVTELKNTIQVQFNRIPEIIHVGDFNAEVHDSAIQHFLKASHADVGCNTLLKQPWASLMISALKSGNDHVQKFKHYEDTLPHAARIQHSHKAKSQFPGRKIFEAKIDHILYSSNLTMTTALKDFRHSPNETYPCKGVPSDHIPIYAEFKFST